MLKEYSNDHIIIKNKRIRALSPLWWFCHFTLAAAVLSSVVLVSFGIIKIFLILGF